MATSMPAALDLVGALTSIDWVTAVTSVGSALLGAWVGGRMTAASADRTLSRTQNFEREKLQTERQRAAALDLVRVLLDAREDLIADDGQLLEPDVVRSPLRRLRRDVALALPTLAGCGLEKRLETVLELLSIELSSAESVQPDPDARARVAARLAHDRLEYLAWVVASLQDFAAGRPVPDDAVTPAPLADANAEPWAVPAVVVPPKSPPDRRRIQLRRPAPPGQKR